MAFEGKKDISDLVAEVFKRGGIKRAVKRANVVLLWPQVAGREVAKFATAKVFRDGVLYVDVSDSETSMHLMLQRQKFIDVYRTKYRVRELRDISFKVGEVVQEKTMKLGKSLLTLKARRRAQGWRECVSCGVLSERQPLCPVCERYANSNKVQQAAQILAERPDAELSFLSADQRKVAAYLSMDFLKTRMQELLPMVLVEPKHKAELERRARCFLAHKLQKRLEFIEESDFDLLDHRISRALGRWR